MCCRHLKNTVKHYPRWKNKIYCMKTYKTRWHNLLHVFILAVEYREGWLLKGFLKSRRAQQFTIIKQSDVFRYHNMLRFNLLNTKKSPLEIEKITMPLNANLSYRKSTDSRKKQSQPKCLSKPFEMMTPWLPDSHVQHNTLVYVNIPGMNSKNCIHKIQHLNCWWVQGVDILFEPTDSI